MLIGVLGPLQVTTDGRASSLGSGKLGVLAAVLLCQAGTPVSPRSLADALWVPSAPCRSIDGLRVYVYQLRRMLSASRISRRPSGYELALRAGELDADRFRQLNDRARNMAAGGDLPAARDRLQAALDLWRGPAFAGLQDADVVSMPAGALDELRLDAEEALAAIEMDLGRHGDLCVRLRTLATEHPFREGICGQLILAIYRAGRQAEVLAVFAETRQLFARELGIDPGARLCELQEQMLRGDPSLLRAAGGGPIEISRRPAPTPPAPPAPRQLPPDIEDFTGRTDELAELVGTPGAAPASGLVVISGAAGIGKTALAVHAAQRLAGLFPDGQLYLDLRGHHQRAPVHPLDALAQWLRASGIPPERVPSDLPEATAVFPSRVVVVPEDRVVAYVIARHERLSVEDVHEYLRDQASTWPTVLLPDHYVVRRRDAPQPLAAGSGRAPSRRTPRTREEARLVGVLTAVHPGLTPELSAGYAEAGHGGLTYQVLLGMATLGRLASRLRATGIGQPAPEVSGR